MIRKSFVNLFGMIKINRDGKGTMCLWEMDVKVLLWQNY